MNCNHFILSTPKCFQVKCFEVSFQFSNPFNFSELNRKKYDEIGKDDIALSNVNTGLDKSQIYSAIYEQNVEYNRYLPSYPYGYYYKNMAHDFSNAINFDDGLI